MFVQCKNSFVIAGRKHIAAGTIFNEDDPIVVKYRPMFAPLDVVGEPVVEQATAAPGEKRATKRAAKS